MMELKDRVIPKVNIDWGKNGGDRTAISFRDSDGFLQIVTGAVAEVIANQQSLIDEQANKLKEAEEALVTIRKILQDEIGTLLTQEPVRYGNLVQARNEADMALLKIKESTDERA